MLGQRQLHQHVIPQAKQRRLEHAGQREVVLRRHQHIQQSHHVLYFTAVNQHRFLANLPGDVQLTQLVLQRHEAGPLT